MKTDERLPVISLHTPWANWVALGWKSIETRTHDRFKSLLGRRIGIAAEVTAECKDEIASEKQLELQITALEERLRVAAEGLKEISDMVINSARDFEMREIAKNTPLALAKLKPTAEEK